MTSTLAIVDPAYSSWSLRGWLLFRRFGLPVTVETAHLGTPELAALFDRFAPARTVPALSIDGGRDAVLDLGLRWRSPRPSPNATPTSPSGRATRRRAGWPARSAAEMHAGFRALRDACPMNLRRAYPASSRPSRCWPTSPASRRSGPPPAPCGADGPWLFGDYTVADAFFAPVAARVATYGLPVGPEAAAYVAAHLADPAFVEWRALGLADPVVQPHYELDLPERPWPGPARPDGSAAARRRRQPRLDPADDVGQHRLLAEVVQQVVVVALVELQRLVRPTRVVVEELAAPADRSRGRRCRAGSAPAA